MNFKVTSNRPKIERNNEMSRLQISNLNLVPAMDLGDV